jgi:hypothetical protein
MCSTRFFHEHTTTAHRDDGRHARRPDEATPLAFTGFDSVEEAERAAAAAYDAFREWLARERRTVYVPGPRRTVMAEQGADGVHLAAGPVRVGRIIEPDDSTPWAGGYGFELLLPPRLSRSSRLGAARAISRALADLATVPARGRDVTVGITASHDDEPVAIATGRDR